MKRLSAPLDVQIMENIDNKINLYTTNDRKENTS